MVLLMIPLSLLVVSFSYVRLNISPSLPLGLYRLHPVARPLTRGLLVIVEVPGWSARTRPFLKPVAAVAGEWVCRVGQALVIDHRDYGPIYEALRHRRRYLCRGTTRARLSRHDRPVEPR
jgi:type IV secretory pathway protease TraF